MTDRDTFAAAALTGLLANGDYGKDSMPPLAYELADAMLRERANHIPDAGKMVEKPRTPQSDRLSEWERHGSHRWGLGVASDLYDLECRVAVLEKAIHDAAPAARASVDPVVPQPATHGDSDRTDKAAPRPSESTGDTPVTEPMPKEKRAEVSVGIDGPDQDSRVWETHTLPTQPTPGECSRPQEGTSEPAA